MRERVWLASLVALGVLVARAEGLPRPCEEGFSATTEEKPAQAVEAWRATVLIRKEVLQFPRRYTRIAPGSGLILSLSADRSSVLVVTNHHVASCGIRSCRRTVGFARAGGVGEHVWSANVKIIGVRAEKDLAFLRVKVPSGAGVDAVALGDPGEWPAGSAVVAVGHPVLGLRSHWNVPPPGDSRRLQRRFSQGELIGLHPSYPYPSADGRDDLSVDVILHDADLLPGSSGGPLLATSGEVIGLNSAIGYLDGSAGGYPFCADRTAGSRHCLHIAISVGEITDFLARAGPELFP